MFSHTQDNMDIMIHQIYLVGMAKGNPSLRRRAPYTPVLKG